MEEINKKTNKKLACKSIQQCGVDIWTGMSGDWVPKGCISRETVPEGGGTSHEATDHAA